MGAQIIRLELDKKLIRVWLASEFQAGGLEGKVKKIMEIEKRNSEWQG